MRPLRNSLLLPSTLAALPAATLEVYVAQIVPSHCDDSTGLLTAEVTGGVPPYTFQWSIGATTPTITGLPPGAYSVAVSDANGEQVTTQGEVIVSTFSEGGQLGSFRAHCPGGFPVVDLTLHNQADIGAYLWGTPPFTITGPSSVVSAATLPTVTVVGIDSIMRVEMEVPPGSVIGNIANIYFDYNPPVINEPSVLTAEFSTSTGQYADVPFRFAPNPVETTLFVRSNGTDIAAMQVFGADGRLLWVPIDALRGVVDVTALASGTYFLSIRSTEGTRHHITFIKP